MALYVCEKCRTTFEAKGGADRLVHLCEVPREQYVPGRPIDETGPDLITGIARRADVRTRYLFDATYHALVTMLAELHGDDLEAIREALEAVHVKGDAWLQRTPEGRLRTRPSESIVITPRGVPERRPPEFCNCGTPAGLHAFHDRTTGHPIR